MSTHRTIWGAIALMCLAFAPSAVRATTPPYDAIYVFGDSYCDVGNVYTATKGAIPAAPYYNGRFSNGPIWIEHVASAWGLPMAPSLLGGTDFAFGGAYVTSDQSTAFGAIPSVPHQVALYLTLTGGHADPNALYVIEGGGNDILNATGGSPQSLGFEIAAGIAESEFLLRRAGARHFLVPDLLDVGQLPAAKPNASFATAASVAANSALDVLLEAEGFIEGVFIHRLDVFSLFHDVARDSTHFGFTDITDPCLTVMVCADPAHTLFWDTEHPTEFGHAFFAVTVEASLGRGDVAWKP